MRRRNEQNDFNSRNRNPRSFDDRDYDRGLGSDFGRQSQFRFNEDREDQWRRPSNFERYDRVNRGGRFERLNRRFGRDDDTNYNADYSAYRPDDYRAVGDFDSSDGFDRQDRGGFFGKGPKGWKRSSERIRDEVCEILWRNPRIDASDIEVTVEDNCVCLRGSVENRDAKREAENAVEHLSGVEDVRNELRIKREAGTESNLRGLGKTGSLS